MAKSVQNRDLAVFIQDPGGIWAASLARIPSATVAFTAFNMTVEFI
jgi:hypothetical protein